jgi:hypothetical protein
VTRPKSPHGVDIGKVSPTGRFPLHRPATPNQLAFIESLILRRGGDPDRLSSIEVNGRRYKGLRDPTAADASALIDELLE